MKEKKNSSPPKTNKKVYEQPKIVSEQVFETLALACCKSSSCLKYGFPRGLHGVS